jgi:hypothetical protein
LKDLIAKFRVDRSLSEFFRLDSWGVSVYNRKKETMSWETEKAGVPLHMPRTDMDHDLAESGTTCRVIGVKTWIFRGEILQ